MTYSNLGGEEAEYRGNNQQVKNFEQPHIDMTEALARLPTIVFTILYTVLAVVATRPGAGMCREPDNLGHHTSYMGLLHDTFLQLPVNNDYTATADVLRYTNIHRTSLSTDSAHSRCAYGVMNANSQFINGVNYNTTCPFHYELNHDRNRRPMNLVEVVCNCKRRCLGGGPGSRCLPVKYYTRVLRKTGCDTATGEYIYRTTVETIVAGCTCGYPFRYPHILSESQLFESSKMSP